MKPSAASPQWQTFHHLATNSINDNEPIDPQADVDEGDPLEFEIDVNDKAPANETAPSTTNGIVLQPPPAAPPIPPIADNTTTITNPQMLPLPDSRLLHPPNPRKMKPETHPPPKTMPTTSIPSINNPSTPPSALFVAQPPTLLHTSSTAPRKRHPPPKRATTPTPLIRLNATASSESPSTNSSQ